MLDIFVSSEQRYSGTLSNFTFNLPQQIHAKQIELRYIALSNTFYNVRTGVNDLIPLNGGDITLPAGNYNIDELITELITQGMPASYNSVTMRIEFGVPQQFEWATRNASNNANRILGFPYLVDTTTSVCPFAPDLRTGPFLLDIHGIGSSVLSTSTGFATFMITNEVNKGETNYMLFDSNPPRIESAQTARQIRVKLTYLDETIIPEDQLVNWYFILRVNK